MGRRNQIGSVIALIVIALTNGWHLAPIQGFAWLSMAIEDSDSKPFTHALKSAMNSPEMCGICQYVVEQNAGTDESEIGYWNLIPKWLLTTPRLSEVYIDPPRQWRCAVSHALVLSLGLKLLETPPPKSLSRV